MTTRKAPLTRHRIRPFLKSPILGIGVWMYAVILLLPSLGIAQETTSASADLTPIIAELTSKEFSKRQAAEQALLQFGPQAFEQLIAALSETPREAGERIVSVLELIWLKCPLPEADRLERQLETVRLSPGRYQPDVAKLLLAHHRLREERAVRALRRLNAIVESTLDQSAFEMQLQLGQIIDPPPTRVSQVILPMSWKGSTDDLWHLQRLSHLKSLVVFVVRGNKLTEVDRQRLTVGFPDLQVTERGEIFIGVISDPIAFDNRPGCLISTILEESPADIAGLQAGDRIHRLDGREILNFSELVEALQTKSAYEPIDLVIERFGEEMEVTLYGAPWESKMFPRPPIPPRAERLVDEPDIPPLLPLHGHFDR